MQLLSNRKGTGCLEERHTHKVISLDKVVIFLAVALLFLMPMVVAANPGHGASSISSGTFETGNYTFPNSLFVTDRVGIGTASPTVSLTVVGSSKFTSPVDDSGVYYDTVNSTHRTGMFFSAGGTPDWQVRSSPSSGDLQFYSYDAGEWLLNLGGDGNVGIGTISPSSKLEVNGKLSVVGSSSFIEVNRTSSSYVTLFNLVSGASSNSILQINSNNPSSYSEIISRNGYGLSLNYNGNSSKGLYVDTLGNVGVGTINPSTKLDVNGSINITDASGKLYSPEICLAETCLTDWSSVNQSGGLWTNSSGNATYMDGNVGIGTLTPNYLLDVSNGDINTNSAYRVSSATVLDMSGSILRHGIASGVQKQYFYSNGTLAVTLDTTGYLGVGTDTPTADLEISNGTQSVTFDPDNYNNNPTINTTGSTDLILTSSSGNVVIVLG